MKRSKKIRTISKTVGLSSLAILVVSFQNCAKVQFTGVSANEALSVASNPFDPNQKVGDVSSGDGYPSENLRVATAADASAHFVQDCTAPMPDGTSRYNYERLQALAAVINDPTHTLIPVEFAVSFGTTNDTIALFAHQRAILSDTGATTSNIPAGVSYIPVGSRDVSAYVTPDGKAYQAYYQVDHTSALNDYRSGKNCFFDVVQTQGDIQMSDASWIANADNGEPMYPFITKAIPHSWSVASIGGTNVLHAIHFMYFGWCDSAAGCNQATNTTSAYGAGHYGQDMYPNRLFGSLPHTEVDQLNSQDITTGILAMPQPQIVKLYVADLRDGQITNGGALASTSIIPKTELQRGQEVSEDLKDLLGVQGLKTLSQNRNQAILNLSSDFSANDPDTNAPLTFAGMEGMPQLLSNLTLDATEGTVLSAQYTPIVLDLGDVGVMTSSVFGGTYFNMAAAYDPTITGEASFDQPHATAWLGGSLVDVMADEDAATTATPQMLTSLIETGTKLHLRAPASGNKHEQPTALFQHDFQRVTQDGFLVMADSDGLVRSSRNLFGNETVVNGVSYTNGFLALQALSNKNCASEDITQRYFGPWDGALYSTTVQVWVDANRNGAVDDGELLSLEKAGVVAINVCNILSQQATDAFGNGTSLRSAFLYQTSSEDIVSNQTEILNRITTGKTSTGDDASFRLAIDLIFKADTTKNFFSSDKVVVPTVQDLSTYTPVAANDHQVLSKTLQHETKIH